MSDTEIINVFDENGKIIDTISRKEAEEANHVTENVLVFLFSSSGKVWAQLRAATKKHYPGKWDISACGGVVVGEDYAECARRETKEETGLDVSLQYVKAFLNVFPGDNGEERKRLSRLYIGVTDETPQTNEEVDEFKAWEPKALLLDIENNPTDYVPSFMLELKMALKAYEKQKKVRSAIRG